VTLVNTKTKEEETLPFDAVVPQLGFHSDLGAIKAWGLDTEKADIKVDRLMATNVPGIYAAGDIARWPDPHSGDNIRVEHWAVAERQGQVAALNMLGHKKTFDAVPFFWSQHYDIPINYVGHAEKWDEIVVEGSIADKDCLLRYKRGGRVLAVASIFRDVASLEAELDMERAARVSA
jgi:NADPH-dependent 2,4-dienoyl-CoA reductase/sulfur reductase-like enzyme